MLATVRRLTRPEAYVVLRVWDLRWEIREGLVAFLQARYPEHLPRLRGELLGGAPETG